ncbi:putative protein U55, partial [Dissostichus eleginoides]
VFMPGLSQHRIPTTLRKPFRKPFRKPSNQDAVHLLQHNADLGSHGATKSFEAMSMCVVETRPEKLGRAAGR